MTPAPDLRAVFARLRELLRPHEPGLVLVRDAPGDYHLDTPVAPRVGKPLMFAAAQVRTRYVSFHLFPVYLYPDLLDDVSPALRMRMQGKSCFNFRALETGMLDELASLTARGRARMRAEGVLSA